MFDNLTREIILFSVIPVVLVVLIDLIAFIIMRKREKKFRFNYFIKVSLIIANAFVLPLIGGYTIWVILGMAESKTIGDNLWYIALLIFLWIILFVLLIWVYLKAIRELKTDEEIEQEELKQEKEIEDKEEKK